MHTKRKQSDDPSHIHGWPSNLPEEILLLIFSSVPFGSLRQCRLVCRDWYLCWKNIIADQVFRSKHYSQTNHLDDTPDILLPKSGGKYYTVDYQALENLDSVLEPQASKFNPLTYYNNQLYGSCNGLLCGCLSRVSRWTYESFYIVNPFTGETLELSNPAETRPSMQKDDCCIFSFDTYCNNYKVIFVEKSIRTIVYIYTLGSSTWRIERSDSIIFSRSLVLLNGAVHFLTGETGYNISMTAFSISSEKFLEFAVPRNRGDSPTAKSLCLFGECLCLVDEYEDFQEIALSILKDYGLKDSWCKLYVIRREVLTPVIMNSLILVKRLSNGWIFLHSSDGQGYYDPQNEAFEPVSINGIPNSQGVDIHIVSVHKGSLLSPQSVLPCRASPEISDARG